ncbi:hypothetical protein RchiOBHm_Chr3g0447361 [Rosa chinensis]|uniref:Non-specific serine/threonine protein kinase n=1 Tax=Rosa chinensis TaxID=74649 RepID=A0A2P6R4X3_ROSCH|nr:hypothetical protein RchiOBHm_Chr3g0447361 [Rosa chinensis]
MVMAIARLVANHSLLVFAFVFLLGAPPWCGLPVATDWEGSVVVWMTDRRPSSHGVNLVWTELDGQVWVLDRGRQISDGDKDCTIALVGPDGSLQRRGVAGVGLARPVQGIDQSLEDLQVVLGASDQVHPDLGSGFFNDCEGTGMDLKLDRGDQEWARTWVSFDPGDGTVSSAVNQGDGGYRDGGFQGDGAPTWALWAGDRSGDGDAQRGGFFGCAGDGLKVISRGGTFFAGDGDDDMQLGSSHVVEQLVVRVSENLGCWAQVLGLVWIGMHWGHMGSAVLFFIFILGLPLFIQKEDGSILV